MTEGNKKCKTCIVQQYADNTSRNKFGCNGIKDKVFCKTHFRLIEKLREHKLYKLYAIATFKTETVIPGIGCGVTIPYLETYHFSDDWVFETQEKAEQEICRLMTKAVFKDEGLGNTWFAKSYIILPVYLTDYTWSKKGGKNVIKKFKLKFK